MQPSWLLALVRAPSSRPAIPLSLAHLHSPPKRAVTGTKLVCPRPIRIITDLDPEMDRDLQSDRVFSVLRAYLIATGVKW